MILFGFIAAVCSEVDFQAKSGVESGILLEKGGEMQGPDIYVFIEGMRLWIFQNKLRAFLIKHPRSYRSILISSFYVSLQQPNTSQTSSICFFNPSILILIIYSYLLIEIMNRLTSIAQIKLYQAKPLSQKAHEVLAKSLKLFSLNSAYTQLGYSYPFQSNQLPFLHEKMSRIGCIADEIEHHPEWTLREGHLDIRLSTHDIGNKVSIKDYVLAQWIQQVLHGKSLEEELTETWNHHQFNIEELQ